MVNIFSFFLLTVVTVLVSQSAWAQEPKNVTRIGYLAGTNPVTQSNRISNIRRALRELGYTEGRNITIEYRFGEAKSNRLPGLAAELVHLKVDLIVVAGGTNVVRAAMNATKTIPIIMTGGGIDPVKSGIVTSLARPGGNVTGLTSLTRELVGKRLELLKEAFPKVARIAVLYDPAAPGFSREMNEEFPVASRALGLTIQPWEVRGADAFEAVFDALNMKRPDALYVAGGAIMMANQKRIVAFALASRLPSMYYRRNFVDAGGLMYYGADEAENYRRVAHYVDRILKGAQPSDLPVEQPTKFEFVINLKTANLIGLKIPQWTLMKADKVIK